MSEARSSFPDSIREQEFRSLYRRELDRHSVELVNRIRQLLGRTDVGAGVERVDVEVFADEDGDGFVNVGVYFEGRDRKVSKSDPTLYSGKCIDISNGMKVPPSDPSSYDFDPRDASVATVIEWFAACWEQAGGDGYRLPAVITGHDGFGSSELRPLNAVARGAKSPRGSSQGKSS